MSNWDDDGPAEGERDLGADFERLSNLVASNIRKIQNNVTALERLVQQVGTEADSETLRGRLHGLTTSTNALAKDANKLLKDLAHIADNNRSYKLEKDRLTSDLMAVLNNFQAAQRAAAKKEKESVLRARANSQAATDLGGSSSGGGGFGSGTEALAPQRLQLEQNVDLQAIKEREGAIRQLEDDIVGVNQIFSDLATMVHEQGDMVDSIETHVEVAAQQVEAGARSVHKASNYQTSARKKKIICAVLGVIALIILILVIYFSTKGK